jgi:NAD(P)-dependent dehydrogenase (short-subunit alcohol dehydrogenase family)
MAERLLASKNVLITGGTAGIGAAAARLFAEQGAQVLLLGRDRLRGERLAAEIGLETRNESIFTVACDLSSPDDVHRAAAEVARRCRCVDILVNNAGLFLPRRELTAQGHEKTFASLYLGHFLLTQLLLDRLLESQQGRILCVTCPPSKAQVHFDDFTLSKKYSTLKAQFQAKGAQFMMVNEMARRLQGSDVTINAMLPGMMIKTELLKRMNPFMRLPVALFGMSATKAATHEFHLSTAPELAGASGKFFYGRNEKSMSGQIIDPAACRQLWEMSIEMTGLRAGVNPLIV